ALVRISLGLAIGSAVARVLLVAFVGPSSGVYVTLPTRLDALTIGAWLAASSREPLQWERIRRFALPVRAGALLVVATVFRLDALDHDGAWTQTLGFPALAAVSAAAIVSATTAASGTTLGWIWRRRSLQFLGKYSYGIYGWHPFAIALVRERIVRA